MIYRKSYFFYFLIECHKQRFRYIECVHACPRRTESFILVSTDQELSSDHEITQVKIEKSPH